MHLIFSCRLLTTLNNRHQLLLNIILLICEITLNDTDLFSYFFLYILYILSAGQVTCQRLTWTHLCQVSCWTLMCLLSAGLTAAAMAEALKLQKMRMMMGFHGNSDQQRHHNGAESENDDTGTPWHHHQSLNLKDEVTSWNPFLSPLSLSPCPPYRRQWRILGEGAAPPLFSSVFSCSASSWFSVSPPQHSAAPQHPIGQPWVTALVWLDDSMAFSLLLA